MRQKILDEISVKIKEQIERKFEYEKRILFWDQKEAEIIVTNRVMENIKYIVQQEIKTYINGEDFIDKIIKRIKRKQL